MRIIEVKIIGSHVIRDSRNAGVQGEANATALRIEFDPGWDGLAKTLVWWNALGEKEVKRVLTVDLLEELSASGRIYLVPIPPEALTEPGQCRFAIDGYTDGKRVRSVYSELTVQPAGGRTLPDSDPTPTQAEQLQVQMDTVIEKLDSSVHACEMSEGRASDHAASASASLNLTRSYASGGTGLRPNEDITNARYYMEQARYAAGKIPALTSAQKTALRSLMQKYLKNAGEFIYDNAVSRNAYAPGGDPYDRENGSRIRVNCSALPQLVWAGIDSDSFVGKRATYTGELIRAFDWGFQFDFPSRRAYGLKKSDGGLYGFVKPHEDSYEDSYSCNTYYSESSSRPDKQNFKAYLYGSDMAQEAYVKGFEIPLGCAEVGDIIFYRAPSLHDSFQDGANTKAFRSIGHVGMVYDTNYKEEGILTILESTDYYEKPIAYNSQRSSYSIDIVRAADLADRACMCIRHPAAFGVPSNMDGGFRTL